MPHASGHAFLGVPPLQFGIFFSPNLEFFQASPPGPGAVSESRGWVRMMNLVCRQAIAACGPKAHSNTAPCNAQTGEKERGKTKGVF